MLNLTVADLAQTTLATFAFALFLLPPGYLLGLAGNAFGMRSRSAAEKILFSAAYSIAVTPILAVLVTRLSSYKVTLALFLLLAVISISTLVRQLPLPAGFLSRIQCSTWILLGMMFAWFLLVQFSLADLQIGQRLYVNYVAYDHSVRVPLVEAAARTGVPPLNPFYALGKIPVLRYYYYWYVVCALPVQLFGLSARACLNASIFWSGLGLSSIIPLFLKYVLGERENLRGKSVIAVALLAVTGLDLIPYFALVLKFHIWLGDMEWWDPNQVSSWLGSLLWVPHHVASLTACMVGLLALSSLDEGSAFHQRVWAAVIAGVAFASAAGLSVYVTFTFAIFAILWALLLLAQNKLKTFAAYAAGGVLSVLLSGPFLLDLLERGAASGATPVPRFAFFALRDFPIAIGLLSKLGMHNALLLGLAKVPILLIVYAFEFGFFALVMGLRLRRDLGNPVPLGKQRRMLWLMFTVCLLTMSILQSDSTGSNDLGFRGILVVQFVLLIWSAPLIHDFFCRSRAIEQVASGVPWIKFSLIFTLVLGVAGSAYQLVALRCYPLLADAKKLVRTETFLGSPGFGERTYWMRKGFGQLSQLTSSSATVQYNPLRDEVAIAHLYSIRQAVVGDAECGTTFGGDPQECKKALPYVAAIFNSPDVVRSWNLDRFCEAYQVDVLVATDTDPVWNDPYSWVWTRPSLYANPSLRAVACGAASLSPARRQ
ncbi:MAG: hypothetical protein ABSD13_08515 [Candidatus Korobacteraceae bacterium]|jgi:hypothetical protein